VIEAYLRELASRLPATRRTRVLGEAEDHLRQAAAALVEQGLDEAEAEVEAVRAFGPVDEVVRHLAPLVAAVAVRRATVVGLVAALGLVLPLYGIPENTLPPAPWEERPQLLSVLIDAGLISWGSAIALAVAALGVVRRRPRASAALLAGSAAAVVLAGLAGVAALVAWLAEAQTSAGWQPVLVAPVAFGCALLAVAAALWARDRARVVAT
jgi:hypothetical protein